MSVLKLKVKKPWNGLVAIRDKYVVEAENEGHHLEIVCEGKTMTIENAWLGRKIHSRSKESFFDRFSGESHYLVYFLWQPDLDPPTLFD